MLCPICGGQAFVKDKRDVERLNEVRRRYECCDCGERFTTYEKLATEQDREITAILRKRRKDRNDDFAGIDCGKGERTKTMTLQELTFDVHDNAVKHGWWEKEKPFYEVCALIHSEWSEALEEYRASRPMVWTECGLCKGYICDKGHEFCKRAGLRTDACIYASGRKPEGIAVELIDGCIRILDFLGSTGIEFSERVEDDFKHITDADGDMKIDKALKEMDLIALVNMMHDITSEAMTKYPSINLCCCFITVMRWVFLQGVDPLKVLMMKHEYNKSRSYRHGDKLC